jgi:carbon-monoxide dehydrogenase large subunit
MLEVGPDDLEWEVDRFKVKGLPEKQATMKEIAFAAYANVPDGMEPGLEAVNYYDPPNFTFPFGAYVCVVDVDPETGEVKVRRFYALDDCGTRINPMVIEGQVHGGLTEAFAIALGQELTFDEIGNIQGASLMDYFLPNVGGVSAFSNAVVDAFAHLGVTHMPMPHTAWRVWQTCRDLGLSG